jgi:hypothetical protein
MAGINEPVRRGQLRQWKDVSGSPFTILEVDRTKASWNCKLLRDGEIYDYHEVTIRMFSAVISETG